MLYALAIKMSYIYIQPLAPSLCISDQSSGGLLTLFLYDPLLAFCVTCKANNIRKELWDKCQGFLHKISAEILEILYSFVKDLGMIISFLFQVKFVHLDSRSFIEGCGDAFLCLSNGSHKSVITRPKSTLPKNSHRNKMYIL